MPHILRAVRLAALGPTIVLFLLCTVHLTVFGRAPARIQAGVVVHVVDGDTVWVKTASIAKPLKVRILGIDAPEICQTGGWASRDALYYRLLHQQVTLTVSSGRQHDDYGRVLARIDFRGEDVGHWMVSNGLAWSYAYRRSPGLYAYEQSQAEGSRRGLFGDTAPEAPWRFRKRHGTCYF